MPFRPPQGVRPEDFQSIAGMATPLAGGLSVTTQSNAFSKALQKLYEASGSEDPRRFEDAYKLILNIRGRALKGELEGASFKSLLALEDIIKGESKVPSLARFLREDMRGSGAELEEELRDSAERMAEVIAKYPHIFDIKAPSLRSKFNEFLKFVQGLRE